MNTESYRFDGKNAVGGHFVADVVAAAFAETVTTDTGSHIFSVEALVGKLAQVYTLDLRAEKVAQDAVVPPQDVVHLAELLPGASDGVVVAVLAGVAAEHTVSSCAVVDGLSAFEAMPLLF